MKSTRATALWNCYQYSYFWLTNVLLYWDSFAVNVTHDWPKLMFGWNHLSLLHWMGNYIKIVLFFSQKYCCYLNKKGHVLGKFKSLTTKHNSIYQCQWNTRWAFPQKHDIFTCENDMLFSHVKRSLLLWLHNTLHPSQQKKKLSKMVWYFTGVYIIKIEYYMAACRYKFSLLVFKNIPLVRCTHSWNVFQNLERNFISLYIHVISSTFIDSSASQRALH